MPKLTHKKAIDLLAGDRIEFFRGETDAFRQGERNEPMTDTVKTVQVSGGNRVAITTVSGHVIRRLASTPFRLGKEDTEATPPLAAKPIPLRHGCISIE